jgi:hypothetical protein
MITPTMTAQPIDVATADTCVGIDALPQMKQTTKADSRS